MFFSRAMNRHRIAPTNAARLANDLFSILPLRVGSDRSALSRLSRGDVRGRLSAIVCVIFEAYLHFERRGVDACHVEAEAVSRYALFFSLVFTRGVLARCGRSGTEKNAWPTSPRFPVSRITSHHYHLCQKAEGE